MLKEGARIGHQFHVGEMSTVVQIFLYEKVVVNSITHNLAAVNYWRKSDIINLEKVQAMLLKNILKLPESTPYWGLLNELGIWPLEDVVNYKKMLLLQNILSSDDSRLTKQLITHQKRFEIEESWYSNLNNIGKKYRIEMENEEIMKDKKTGKMHVKGQIMKNVIERSKEKVKSMTKLRHQNEKTSSCKAMSKRQTFTE